MSELNEEQLTGLIRRHRELSTEAAAMSQEAKSIKEMIDAEVENGWTLTVDGIQCSKRAGNREFNLALGVASLPAELREACKVTRFDDKLVRENLKRLGLEDNAMQDKPDAKSVVKLA